MYKIEYNPSSSYTNSESKYVATWTVDAPELVDSDLIDTSIAGWVMLAKDKGVIKLLPSHRVKAITYVE